MREEGIDLLRAHRRGMPLVVKENEAPRPVDVGLLRPDRILTDTDRVLHTIEQARWLRGFHASMIPRYAGCGRFSTSRGNVASFAFVLSASDLGQNLARLSRGKLLGVDFNKAFTWVGSSIALSPAS